MGSLVCFVLPLLAQAFSDRTDRLAEMRYQNMTIVDQRRLRDYAARFKRPRLGRAVERWLELAGKGPEVRSNDRKTVHPGWVRLGGLLHDAGLSPMADEKLAIKVEVDTRPPVGGRSERRLATRRVSYRLQCHDLPSLLAGKVHALLTRGHANGREWYDLQTSRSCRMPSLRCRGPTASMPDAEWTRCGGGCLRWTSRPSARMSGRSWNVPRMPP